MTVTDEMLWATVDVVRLTGATYRQLDYWCSESMVPGQPADVGQGNPRRWTYRQVRHVRCLQALLAAGVTGPALRQVVETLTDPQLDWYRPLELDHAPFIRLSLDLPALR